MRPLAIVVALVGFAFGLLSAWHWYRSSQTPFNISAVTAVSPAGVYIGSNDLERYLRAVGGHNRKAAICGAIGAFLSTLASLIG
jgi:hypothetical protein